MNIAIDMRDPIPNLDIAEIKAWVSPFEKEQVSEEKKQEIFDNVYHYLTAIRGFKVETNR